MGFSTYGLSVAGQGDYARFCPATRLGVALIFAFVCSVIIHIIFVIVIIFSVVFIVIKELSGLAAFGLRFFTRRSVGVIQD